VTPLEILRLARWRITSPERWTTGAFARDAAGEPVGCLSSEACSWCILGAIVASELGGSRSAVARDALRLTISLTWPVIVGAHPVELPLGPFNDLPSTTHAVVLDVFDRSIARLEAEVGPS
jgi:hypothetical protein